MDAKHLVSTAAFLAGVVAFDALSQPTDDKKRIRILEQSLADAALVEAEIVSRVDPIFPAGAGRAKADRGQVKARMTIDAAGNVTSVEVVEARPRRLFDQSVVEALSQWKFKPGAEDRKVETEIGFTR